MTTAPDGTLLEGGDIVIVDDEPNNLSVLKRILIERGYRVRPAINGEVALKAVQSRPPDLILLDVLMPGGMNGFQVCEHLKADERLRDIPVLFISALTETAEKLKAFEIGGLDYINKPFQAEEVLARVGAQLKLRRMGQRLLEQNESLRNEIEARKQAQEKLAKANSELEKLVNLDGLTRVPNRRLFDTTLDSEHARAKRHGTPLALCLCDIDFFKRYNDTYGHLAGDDCLRQVAGIIQNALKRPSDLAARYGGEEFAIILPDTTTEGALHIAQTVVHLVAAARLPHSSSETARHVTVSLGLVTTSDAARTTPQKLIEAADTALYQAKASGRNQAVAHRL